MPFTDHCSTDSHREASLTLGQCALVPSSLSIYCSQGYQPISSGRCHRVHSGPPRFLEPSQCLRKKCGPAYYHEQWTQVRNVSRGPFASNGNASQYTTNARGHLVDQHEHIKDAVHPVCLHVCNPHHKKDIVDKNERSFDNVPSTSRSSSWRRVP